MRLLEGISGWDHLILFNKRRHLVHRKTIYQEHNKLPLANQEMYYRWIYRIIWMSIPSMLTTPNNNVYVNLLLRFTIIFFLHTQSLLAITWKKGLFRETKISFFFWSLTTKYIYNLCLKYSYSSRVAVLTCIFHGTFCLKPSLRRIIQYMEYNYILFHYFFIRLTLLPRFVAHSS